MRLKLNAVTIAALVTLALFVALVPLSIFYQQHALSTQALVDTKLDSVLWQAQHLEREHSRLRMALRDALDAPPADGQQELALRYAIFYSRYDVVKNGPVLAPLHGVAAYREAMLALDAFVMTADAVLAEIDSRPVAAPAIAGLLSQSKVDQEPVRAFADLDPLRRFVTVQDAAPTGDALLRSHAAFAPFVDPARLQSFDQR